MGKSREKKSGKKSGKIREKKLKGVKEVEKKVGKKLKGEKKSREKKLKARKKSREEKSSTKFGWHLLGSVCFYCHLF